MAGLKVHGRMTFIIDGISKCLQDGGYVVIAPNPRGSSGYGQKFTDEIRNDWGGKVYVDLMNTYDYAIKNFSFIDLKNTFAAGASYGGYMINWIEGHTDRFNALFCHNGSFNLGSKWGTTEELWFPEWEFEGTPWETGKLMKNGRRIIIFTMQKHQCLSFMAHLIFVYLKNKLFSSLHLCSALV